jgi:SAM-dependent methyltransferase
LSDDSTRAARLYEPFAERYHLIYEDWWAAAEIEGEVLDNLLRAEGVAPPGPLLDCTCGIGTQALPLAALGWSVTGTDLTPAAVDRARREAAERGIALEVGVADVRRLGDALGDRTFAAVLTCDNALPHLQTEEDLGAALGSIAGRLVPGGLLLATVRDYDAVLADRPTGIAPWTMGRPGARRVMTQAWWWDPSGAPAYDFDLFVLEEGAGEDGGWRTTHVDGRYRAWRRAELVAAVEAAGYVDVRWLAEGTGWYQPVILARRPS